MKRQIDRRVDFARADARDARARIKMTVEELRYRLDPRVVAAETADQAISQVSRIIDEAGSAAKTRPWLLAVAATLFGLVLTLRAKLPGDGPAADRENATNADA